MISAYHPLALMASTMGLESFLWPSGPLSLPPTDSKIHIDFLSLRPSTATQPMLLIKFNNLKRTKIKLKKYRNTDLITSKDNVNASKMQKDKD